MFFFIIFCVFLLFYVTSPSVPKRGPVSDVDRGAVDVIKSTFLELAAGRQPCARRYIVCFLGKMRRFVYDARGPREAVRNTNHTKPRDVASTIQYFYLILRLKNLILL
jgi:hypothetical protein